MEGRAKQLEKFHVDLATKRSDELKEKAKDIKSASLIKADNAKETQMKAAQLKFDSDKTILGQEKQQMDNKAMIVADKNKAEELKEMAFRKLEQVRLKDAHQRMEKVEAAVKAAKLHLQAKLKLASTLQAKAMKMEAKDKVQPDVIHQIIVNIKAATMEAIKANRDLKTLEQHHEQVTHDYAALQDKVSAAEAKRAERKRLLVARVESDKAEFLNDVSGNTSTTAENFYREAEKGIDEMHSIIEDSVTARKEGKHFVGPLNSLKNRIDEVLGKADDSSLTTSFAPMDKALAEANVAASDTAASSDTAGNVNSGSQEVSKVMEAKEVTDKYFPYKAVDDKTPLAGLVTKSSVEALALKVPGL